MKSLTLVVLLSFALVAYAGAKPPKPIEPVEPEPYEPEEKGEEPEVPVEPQTPEEPEEPVEPAEPTPCAGAPDTSCKAFAFLEIEVTAGECSGEASASCTAVSESFNEVSEAINDWWSDEDEYCDSGEAVAAAEAIATAIAHVYADAFTKVSCEGEGFACGWSIAGGKAWAVAFAEAIAQASAEAMSNMPDADAEAFCYADIRALATVIADAAADAQSDACTTGGEVEDFQASLADALVNGIATAFATAQASACTAEGAAAAETKCTGKAGSEAEGDVIEEGDACAGIVQVSACTGAGDKKCCDPSYKRRFCKCDGCKKRWKKVKKADAKKGDKRTWKTDTGDLCFCKDVAKSVFG